MLWMLVAVGLCFFGRLFFCGPTSQKADSHRNDRNIAIVPEHSSTYSSTHPRRKRNPLSHRRAAGARVQPLLLLLSRKQNSFGGKLHVDNGSQVTRIKGEGAGDLTVAINSAAPLSRRACPRRVAMSMSAVTTTTASGA